MRKQILLLLGVMAGFTAFSQNPATTFTIANRNITLPCGTSCTSINAKIPHIKQTTGYVVTNPAYVPFAYTTPTGTVVSSIYVDDTWSQAISLPFPFCFYGNNFNSLLMGSNSAITFDVSRAGSGSGYSISATTGAIPNTAYAPNMIFGPYHDIDPGLSSANKKIEWRIEGTAPRRRFIASYNDMPYFGSSCTTPRATHQMVLYEATGIVEVYIKDKPFCTSWNSGLAILGMQNQTRTSAIAAAGKNATVWGTTAMDSCFRFIPSGSTSRLKSAQLVMNGTVVANADTSTFAAGVLDLNFPNVCPTADSTAYVIRATFGQCTDPAQDVVFTDTVFVKRTAAPTAAIVKTDATCTTAGSITVNATGGTTPYEYSINGGTSYQSSNVFNNLTAGTYNVNVRTVGSTCASAAQQTTITLTDNLVLNAGNGSTICLGQSFTPSVTSNATSYNWSPTTGVSNPSIANPVLAPTATTTYTVTATLGTCTKTGTVTVVVAPGATVNAGADAFIIAGDTYTLQGSGSAGTYLWTPSVGLSATNILKPVATPQATTTYTLNVTTPLGCIAADDVTITVVPYCIKPMEAFTPNGDGINDRWLITNGNCLKSATAQVFNRYGAKVFESNDYKNTWDGTYKGNPLPDGTYYYVISFELINSKKVSLKGSVTILR
ncbi:MAG: gliding motility-associated C-terminal domain-containing protein [Chitinophagaceae bacterium]|nr:gliding motility-associated C-terminal domain-containing protein [Chitinophagaceae bacterium]